MEPHLVTVVDEADEANNVAVAAIELQAPDGRAAFWAPIGLVILGGLTTSTFLTVMVIPIVYSLIDDLATFAARIPRMVRFVSEFGADSPSDDVLDDLAEAVLLRWDR
mgnify:CR=1 FL=1